MDKVPGTETSVQKMNSLLEGFYNKTVFPLARQMGLPIIDCTRSFDIYDSDLYKK